MTLDERRGVQIDTQELSRQLGVPMVPTAIKTGRGKRNFKV